MNTKFTADKCVPSSRELKFLEDRLYEFNSSQTGRHDGQSFAYFIRNDRQEIIGGISGWTWAYACEIRALWVHPAFRRKGYGSNLLQAAEKEAAEHDCKVILLESYSFQAPAFYQKNGYELTWQLNDFPPGYRYCYLIKRINRAGDG
jgi:GNAT superfamily N-acetyltransferase